MGACGSIEAKKPSAKRLSAFWLAAAGAAAALLARRWWVAAREAMPGRANPGVDEITALDGAGALLQRTYTGVIVDTDWTPQEIMRMVRSEFERFSEPELAKFTRDPDARRPLRADEEMGVFIAGAGEAHVRVIDADERTLTMRTMTDHPEAGRITFGAWRDEQGRVVFRIRSRTRQNGPLWLAAFHLGGKQLQSKIWEIFIARVAEAAGGRLADDVKVETIEVEERLADAVELDAPTFKVPA